MKKHLLILVALLLFASTNLLFARQQINSGETYTVTGASFQNADETKVGAVFYNKGTLIVNKSNFTNNKTTEHGGAILNDNILIIGQDVVFNSNYSGLAGGAIYNNSCIVEIGNMVTFSSNKSNCSGGAIYNNNYGKLTIGNNATFSSNMSYFGGAIYNCKNSTTAIGNNATFSSNESKDSCGGAINNGGSFTIGSNATFSSNESSFCGGAIGNEEIITIGNNATFSSNSAENGGAISNSKILTIGDNATFSSNSSINSGGAIYNYADGTVIIGNEATFSSNSAENGGAISNSKILTIGDNATFSSNSSISSGGAIYNYADGTVIIGNEATFSSNSAENGGAIYNYYGTVTIGNGAIFSSNSAEIFGGAILNNNGTVIIGDGATFSSNMSYCGGAIYNDCAIVDLIAKTNNIEFTGNKGNGVSNAIRDNAGTINLWAGTADIIFNDRITSYNSSSVLNINSSTTTLTANGKVIINEDMSGYVGTTNLQAGTLKIGEQGQMFGGTLNVTEGAVVDSINNKIEEIYINKYSGNMLLEIDAKLKGGDAQSESDRIWLANDSLGTVTLSNVNILEFDTDFNSGYFCLFPDKDISNLVVDLKVNTGGEVISFSKDTGIEWRVRYEKLSGTQTLKEMVADTTAYKVYNLTTDENVTEKLGDLEGTQLIVNGNGKNITTQNSSGGFNIASDKILKIENIGTISGFRQNYGGAIYNKGTVTIGNGTMFSSNSASWGGAIYNYADGTVTIGNEATFSSNSSINSGGAIYNDNNSTITMGNNATFSSNSAERNGGAIYNYDGTVTIGNGTMFSSNSASWGGAIYNYADGTVIIGDGATFSSNSAEGNGGAIYNDPNGTVTIGNGAIFSSNSAEIYGGAIFNNNNGTVTIGNGTMFSSNSAEIYGGAIYNKGTVTIGNGTMFSSNSASWGGAIYNYADVTVIIGDGATFSSNMSYCGGAIYNDNNSTITMGNNATFSSNESKDSCGGAIYNNGGSFTIGSNATFSSNESSFCGGAIYNNGELTIQDGAKFVNNESRVNGFGILGGAIDNNNGGMLNLIAKTNNIEFTGNKGNGVSNAIRDNAGTINLWASNSADIIFNDRITSYNSSSVLNINSSTTTLTATGKVILNEDMSGYTGTVNLYAGTLKLGKKGTMFGGNLVVDNATINLANAVVRETNFHNLTINNILNLTVDADLKAEKMDTITADSYTNGNKINVTAVNIIKDTSKKDKISLEFVKNDDMKQDVINKVTKAYSDMWEYDVNYDATTGNMSFLQGNMVKVNPMTQSSAVSGIGSYVSQVTIANQAFASVDNRIDQIRQEAKTQTTNKSTKPAVKTDTKTNTKSTNTKQTDKNKTQNKGKKKAAIYTNMYASANTSQVFEPNTMGKIERGLWLRPYVVSDTLDLGAVSSVDNTMYGTLAGYDMPVDGDKLLSFYIGYTGGNQKYEEIKVNQTAYVLGATGMLIKDKWYVGATVNVGTNKVTADNPFGSDDINKTTYSIGFKGGYDFDLGKNWMLQPNMILMYIGATSSEYTNTQGNKIKDNGIGSILIQPGVKANLKLKDGWTPYGLLDVAINTGEVETEVNGTKIENIKLDPYFEYGVGVNKAFVGTAWSCYGQVTGKSGSRSGVGFNFGVKYTF